MSQPPTLPEAVANLVAAIRLEVAQESARSREPEPPRLLTLSETADRLGVSPSSVKRMVSRGELPTVLVGRRRLVRSQDLELLTGADR